MHLYASSSPPLDCHHPEARNICFVHHHLFRTGQRPGPKWVMKHLLKCIETGGWIWKSIPSNEGQPGPGDELMSFYRELYWAQERMELPKIEVPMYKEVGWGEAKPVAGVKTKHKKALIALAPEISQPPQNQFPLRILPPHPHPPSKRCKRLVSGAAGHARASLQTKSQNWPKGTVGGGMEQPPVWGWGPSFGAAARGPTTKNGQPQHLICAGKP